MSLDKQGTVKSELSACGGLKLKIKRQKNSDDAKSLQWVTEARGHGVGKLVIKRKGVGSVHKSPDASNTGVQTERPTEQRPNGPILRLSITSNMSGDGQVKCWSLCEVPPVAEDVPSVSELSPASQLQSSPKDSGIDISSPPHDDGAVNIEPNPATGIWSTAVDSLPIEADKAASSPEKLETAVAGFHADEAVPSGSKTMCLKTETYSCDSNSPKVQSTLRSRRERSALRSLANASRKLVNPLAKSHAVGRYQHMLPVNRIRAESNIARRSSLEESPTYNMLASRTSPCKPLPRVRTKLKLLSNNTYAPVFDQGESVTQPAVGTETSKHSRSRKSPSADTERKRNRHSRTSSKSDALEIMKVKLCYGDSENDSIDAQGVEKLPKLKLVVKSEPIKSVSCIKQEMDDTSTEQVEEKAPVRSTRSQRDAQKSKTSGNSISEDQIHRAVDGINTNHLLSSKLEDSQIGRFRHKRLEAKQVDDREPVAKKCRLRTCPPLYPVNQTPDMSDSQQSSDKNRMDGTSKSGLCSTSSDTVAHDVSMSLSSVIADKLSTEVGKEQAAVQPEAESTSDAEIKPSELPAESESSSPHGSHSITSDSGTELHLSKDSSSDSEKCAELNSSDTDTNDISGEVVSRLDDNHIGEAVKEDVLTMELQNSTSGCISEHNKLAVLAPDSSVPATTICTNVMPVEDTPDDHSGESNDTDAVFEDSSVFSTVGQPVLSANVDSVTQNTNCTNSGSADSGNITELQNDDLLKSPAVSVDTCGVLNNSCNVSSVDPAKLDIDNTEHGQDILHKSVETAASSDENSELKSLCFLPDELRNLPDECKLLVNDITPSSLLSLSPLCCSNEHKETAAATVASSNGFLAAFTQFVQKAGTKKKPASCSVTEADSASTSDEKITSKSGCSQKSVIQRPCSAHKRRRTYSDKLPSAKNRSPRRVFESKSAAEIVSVNETCSLEAGRSAEIALKGEMLSADCSSGRNEVAAIITDKLCTPDASTGAYSEPGKDVTSEFAEDTTAQSGSGQKVVRKKRRQRQTASEKHALSKNRSRCRLSVSESALQTVSVKDVRSPETGNLAEIRIKSEIPMAQNSASDCISVCSDVANKPCTTASESSDNILHSAEKTVATSGLSPKSNFFSRHSRRRRRTSSEKQTASRNRLQCLPAASEDTVETVCVKETALPVPGSTAFIATPEDLPTVCPQDSTSQITPVISDKPFVSSSSFYADIGHDKGNTLQSGCSQTSIEQKPFSPHRQQNIKPERHTALENSFLHDLYECENTAETDIVQEMFSLLTGNLAEGVVKNATSTTQQQNSGNEVAAVVTDKPCTLTTGSLAVSETDKGIMPTVKKPAKYRSSQTSVRRGPFSRAFSAHKQQRTFSEKQNSSDSRMPLHHSDSEGKGDVVSVTETDLVDQDRSAEIACTERLPCTSAVERRPLLSKDELLTVVSADRQLVALRHRVCELIEAVFPEVPFPPGFRRDSRSMERFVKNLTDVLSDSTTDTPCIRQCTDPVVTLHCMPDRCLQTLQQQIIRLLSLILPSTDLSDINVDSLDVLLELVTSLNRPVPVRTFPVSPADPFQETHLRLSNTFSPHRQPLPLCMADTGVKPESVDPAVRTETQFSAGDAFLSVPNNLIPITSPGAAGDKRSIRRQVKDCLMLLDRDLT